MKSAGGSGGDKSDMPVLLQRRARRWTVPSVREKAREGKAAPCCRFDRPSPRRSDSGPARGQCRGIFRRPRFPREQDEGAAVRRRAAVDAAEIRRALGASTIADAAKALGISRATLCRRMAEFGISALSRQDRVGRSYNRWTVVEVYQAGGRTTAKCRCECGAERVLSIWTVESGKSKSCGCLRSEVTAKRSTKHGFTARPEYAVWSGMRQRCNDHGAKNYPWYGGRGVKVCERWDDFGAFFSDMGPRPTPKHSIDRINPFGDYEPSNCEWVTWDRQVQNKRKSHA